jgi:serine/threonine protein phosphatase 1
METMLGWEMMASSMLKARPRVPSGVRIYAVGDIHGRADILADLFASIDQDLKTHPTMRSIEVFLGDYIDRGPHSRRVLDLLIARQRQRRTVFLKGNHEAYAYQVLSDPSLLLGWVHIGGINTLLSYGVKLSNGDHDQQAQQAIAAAFRHAMPDSHYHFLKGLALSLSCGDYFFVHAGVRPGIPLVRQSEQDLLWIRDDFLLHEEDFGKVVVHGHSPTNLPDIRANRINIDTGAYATGRLTCLVLEGDRMRFL